MGILITIIFIMGYIAIATEHIHKINKAALALLIGVLSWIPYVIMTPDKDAVLEQLAVHASEISSILFFFMGALTIVEVISSNHGFDVVTCRITTRNKRLLLLVIALLTFFFSAVFDNLTTTIVMVTLLTRLVPNHDDLMLFTGMTVIAANAGGAWSPIGDVTTTMLWIGGYVTPLSLIKELLLPSIICLLIPLAIAALRLKGDIEQASGAVAREGEVCHRQRNLVLGTGIGVLLFVPIFKTVTHLPPYMGMLLGLGILWILIEVMNHRLHEESGHAYSVSSALQKIDMPSILFFLGILMSVSALQSTGQLVKLANWLDLGTHNLNLIVVLIGFFSAVIDNVPLVAGAMGMYDLSMFPIDHRLWTFLAYCAGTGGSMLVIGSVAGIAAMGMVKMDFFWYLRNISPLSLMGFLGGAAVSILLS